MSAMDLVLMNRQLTDNPLYVYILKPLILPEGMEGMGDQ